MVGNVSIGSGGLLDLVEMRLALLLGRRGRWPVN